MNTNWPNRLNLILFIITLFLSLMVKFDPPVWKNFADPYDYLHQSNMSMSDKEFYFPQKADNFFPRPFTVPMFYKIASSDPDTIVQLQKFFHSLSTFLLCYVVLLFFKNNYTKITFVVFWYLLMSWWNILGWTHSLISESLSLSFMFLWIASFLLFLHKKTIPNIILHIIITILFSFTRDSWPYILVIFYVLFLIIALKWEKKILIGTISFLIISVSIFIIQGKSAQIGQRYRLPIMNNIVFRILPNEEYLKWFVDRGMPCAKELKAQYSNLDDYKKIYPLYGDTAFLPLSEWIIKNGKSVYTKFLITHPSSILLLNEKKENLNRIFAYNIGYSGSIKGYSWISQFIFPIFNVVSILLLNGFLIFLYIKEKKLVWLLPSVLILITTANAFMLYIADSIEMERHLFFTNVLIQFTGILLVTFILDSEYCTQLYYKLKKKHIG